MNAEATGRLGRRDLSGAAQYPTPCRAGCGPSAGCWLGCPTVASSKNAKKRKQAQRKQQAQHRQSHQVERSRTRDASREHLPKTGTKADDDYLMRRSKEDLVDFGLTGARPGWINWAIGAVVFLALLSLIVILVVRS